MSLSCSQANQQYQRYVSYRAAAASAFASCAPFALSFTDGCVVGGASSASCNFAGERSNLALLRAAFSRAPGASTASPRFLSSRMSSRVSSRSLS